MVSTTTKVTFLLKEVFVYCLVCFKVCNAKGGVFIKWTTSAAIILLDPLGLFSSRKVRARPNGYSGVHS